MASSERQIDKYTVLIRCTRLENQYSVTTKINKSNNHLDNNECGVGIFVGEYYQYISIFLPVKYRYINKIKKFTNKECLFDINDFESNKQSIIKEIVKKMSEDVNDVLIKYIEELV